MIVFYIAESLSQITNSTDPAQNRLWLKGQCHEIDDFRFFKLTVFGHVMVVSVGLLQLGLAQPRVEHPVVQDLAITF